jgi:hypothetical protein
MSRLHPKSPLALALTLALLLAGSGPALSCVCNSDLFDDSPRMVREAVSDSSAVFKGKVTSIHPGDAKDSGPRAAFSISDVWKGRPPGEVTVGTLLQGCRIDFEVGEEYLVYALPDSDGYFATSCTRTRQASQAAYDLSVLGQSAQVPTTPQETVD